MNATVNTNRMQNNNLNEMEKPENRNVRILILVVEDDKYMNETLREVLEEEGYKVESSLTVQEAQEKIRYSEKKFNLLILDYNLQFLSGVTGLDIYLLAKERNPAIQAIMISAYGDKKIKEKAREKGISVFLDKPFKINEFTEAVNSISKKINHSASGNTNNFFYIN